MYRKSADLRPESAPRCLGLHPPSRVGTRNRPCSARARRVPARRRRSSTPRVRKGGPRRPNPAGPRARPDLILMDVQLPGMTGYEAARHLKTDPTTAAIPVVALTAQAMRGDEDRAAEAGCTAFLTNPLEGRAFRDILHRLLLT